MNVNNPGYKGAEQPIKGIALICLAVLLFASHDTLSKYLSGFYPIVMVVWARYVVHTLLMLVIFRATQWFLGGSAHPASGFAVITRPVPDRHQPVFFTSGLRYIPLAEATAVTFSCSFIGDRVVRTVAA